MFKLRTGKKAKISHGSISKTPKVGTRKPPTNIESILEEEEDILKELSLGKYSFDMQEN